MATKTKDRKLNTEELELVGLLLEQKSREMDRAKYHDWGAKGKTTHTYCRPIRRKGDEKPLFRKAWVHRFIKSKSISMSLFPDAKKWEYICPGPGCPICTAIGLLREYADRLEEKNRVKRANELRQFCQSGKAKEIRHWVGITYTDDGTIDCIEAYRLLNWYFEKSLLGLLTDKKYTLSQWCKKNPGLKKKKAAERESHWLEHCPPMRDFPDNATTGWKFFVSKSGAGLETKYKAKFEEAIPLSKGSAEVRALMTAVKGGDYPDLDIMLKELSISDMEKSVGALNKLLIPKNALKTEEDDEDLDDAPEEELDENDDISDDADEDDNDETLDEDDDEGSDDSDNDTDDDDNGDDDSDDDDDNDEPEPEPKKKKSSKKKKKKADEEDEDDDSWEEIPF